MGDTTVKRYKTDPWTPGRQMNEVEKALRLAWHEEGVAEDTGFYRAARRARKALNGAQLRAASVDGGPTADLILRLLSDRPLGRGERRTLAGLLAGEMHNVGKPVTSLATRAEYAALIHDIKQKRRELRDQGVSARDADEQAAQWAERDARARGKSWTTILRDAQRKSSRAPA